MHVDAYGCMWVASPACILYCCSSVHACSHNAAAVCLHPFCPPNTLQLQYIRWLGYRVFPNQCKRAPGETQKPPKLVRTLHSALAPLLVLCWHWNQRGHGVTWWWPRLFTLGELGTCVRMVWHACVSGACVAWCAAAACTAPCHATP